MGHLVIFNPIKTLHKQRTKVKREISFIFRIKLICISLDFSPYFNNILSLFRCSRNPHTIRAYNNEFTILYFLRLFQHHRKFIKIQNFLFVSSDWAFFSRLFVEKYRNIVSTLNFTIKAFLHFESKQKMFRLDCVWL